MLAVDLSVGWLEILLFLLLAVMGFWNTTVGPTGGLTFATLAAVLSPTMAVPVQSIVEGVSGVYRGWKLWGYIDVEFVRLFALGGIGGLAAGYGLLAGLSSVGDSQGFDAVLTLVVAGFILVSTWLPIAEVVARGSAVPFVVGIGTTAMSMFVGGMGAPISATVASRGKAHTTVIATSTVAVMTQYAARLTAFGLIGFSLLENLSLIVILTAGSVIGTLIGRRVLVTVDQARAQAVFKVVVTAIAITMIVRAMTAFHCGAV